MAHYKPEIRHERLGLRRVLRFSSYDITPSVIAHRYSDPDDREVSPQAATADAMERFLRTMLDDLVQLALRNGSAALAAHLKASIKQRGSAKLTAVTLRMVEQASVLAAQLLRRIITWDFGCGRW
jgi:hypothetical protein